MSDKPIWKEADTRAARRAAEAKARAERAAQEAERKRLAALKARNLRPDGKTVLSPVKGRPVSTPYKKKPNDNTYWQTRGYHTGADYAANYGENCYAVLGGTWHHLEDPVLGHVGLLFANDGNTYWYSHLQYRIRNGSKVKAGDYVGDVGASGTGANGPHLHLEKRRGHSRSWSGPDVEPVWY